MKRDLRRQTFSKPVKPDDDEIRRLTSDEGENPLQIQKKSAEKTAQAKTDIAPKKKEKSAESLGAKNNQPEVDDKVNPFLLSRGQASQIGIEKTGYRLRSDYMDLLKLVKRMKKGYTLEAVLDDVLTYYFETSEDGRKAVKQRDLLDAD